MLNVQLPAERTRHTVTIARTETLGVFALVVYAATWKALGRVFGSASHERTSGDGSGRYQNKNSDNGYRKENSDHGLQVPAEGDP